MSVVGYLIEIANPAPPKKLSHMPVFDIQNLSGVPIATFTLYAELKQKSVSSSLAYVAPQFLKETFKAYRHVCFTTCLSVAS